MLADLYVVAFKVDMVLADQVWELWNARLSQKAATYYVNLLSAGFTKTYLS